MADNDRTQLDHVARRVGLYVSSAREAANLSLERVMRSLERLAFERDHVRDGKGQGSLPNVDFHIRASATEIEVYRVRADHLADWLHLATEVVGIAAREAIASAKKDSAKKESTDG